MILKRIKTNNLLNAAQEQIKLYIVESGLKPGDPLPTEKKLEEQLGVSRTSIREALRSLEALGIVESRQGVGRFLREFNYDAILAGLTFNIEVNAESFREVFDVRMALESSFLERVVSRISAADIQDLYGILDRMERLVRDGSDEKELIRAHTEFHLRLYESVQNSLLSHLIRIFSTIQRTLTVLDRYRTSDTGEFIELHRRLIEAVEEGDSALAVRRLHEHFKDVIRWNDEYGEVKT